MLKGTIQAKTAAKKSQNELLVYPMEPITRDPNLKAPTQTTPRVQVTLYGRKRITARAQQLAQAQCGKAKVSYCKKARKSS